jgi:hypothetical protein
MYINGFKCRKIENYRIHFSSLSGFSLSRRVFFCTIQRVKRKLLIRKVVSTLIQKVQFHLEDALFKHLLN